MDQGTKSPQSDDSHIVVGSGLGWQADEAAHQRLDDDGQGQQGPGEGLKGHGQGLGRKAITEVRYQITCFKRGITHMNYQKGNLGVYEVNM